MCEGNETTLTTRPQPESNNKDSRSRLTNKGGSNAHVNTEKKRKYILEYKVKNRVSVLLLFRPFHLGIRCPSLLPITGIPQPDLDAYRQIFRTDKAHNTDSPHNFVW